MSTAVAGQLGPARAGLQMPDGWHFVRLSEVCELNPRRPDLSGRADDAPTTFVPMEAVDERQAAVTAAKVRPYREVAKGYTYFAEGDVLFAKITPCMQNGKHAIARGLIDGIGFGSTEFHVTRPGPDITSEWVWYFVRQPSVLADATRYFTGAVGQQRVPEDYLARLRIPLPPLAEQRRIVAVLSERLAAVEKAHAAAEERLRAATSLPGAWLRAAFANGDARSWPRVRLGKHVGKVGSGITPLGGQAVYLREGIPLIRSQNVHMNQFRLDGLAYISAEQDAEMAATRVQPGDVLLNITGASIGRVCVVPPSVCPANVNQHVSIIRCSDDLDAAFLGLYLSTPDFQKFIIETQAGATRQALTKALIEDFRVPLPPISEQRRVASMLCEKIASARRMQVMALEELDAMGSLRSSLLRRAFAGGL